ncbi:MAG: DUF4080 domain-containing protein [Acholeplasmatales bacterium]|nr:DUF4080 domain-containing protein [Acholeplasmatales bacterium]
MKALLIGINTKYIHPSISLYQLKANTNYEVDIREFIIKDKVEKISSAITDCLNSSNYDLIGFSAYLWNIDLTLKVVAVIKQKFPIKVVVGGPEVTYDAEHFLKENNGIDYIIRGEGEYSFNELLMYLDNKISLDKVSNLSYILNNKYIENKTKVVDLSDINLATLMVKDLENQVVYLESSRGCPYRCSYCTASLDNNLRFFPLDKVLNILEYLMKNKAKTVKFLDRTFNANKDYMMSILKFIDDKNICTVFQFEIVVDRLNSDVIEFINTLNHKYLRFEVGIQTIHNEINKNVDRYQNMEKLKENIKSLNNTNNIDLHVDLIAGLPGETKELFIESFNETFNLKCKELQLGFLKFLRGTKLMSFIDKYEYIYNDEAPYEIIESNTMSVDDLCEIKSVEKALNYYYNSNRFKRTFKFLFDNNLLNNPYYMFKKLSIGIDNKQLYSLFIHLDNFFKENLPYIYKDIHYEIICDYLLNHLVKPKKWWDSLTKEEKTNIYPLIVSKLENISIHDLYQYSIVIKNDNKCFIIVYKNYKPSYFEIIL